jgi:hypothetical protein
METETGGEKGINKDGKKEQTMDQRRREGGRWRERADGTDMVISLVMVSDMLETKSLFKQHSKGTQLLG